MNILITVSLLILLSVIAAFIRHMNRPTLANHEHDMGPWVRETRWVKRCKHCAVYQQLPGNYMDPN